MTHNELLAEVETTLGSYISRYYKSSFWILELRSDVIDSLQALRAVVELHKPEYWENIHDPSRNGNECSVCFTDGNLETPSARIDYPCPTIQAIEKELT